MENYQKWKKTKFLVSLFSRRTKCWKPYQTAKLFCAIEPSSSLRNFFHSFLLYLALTRAVNFLWFLPLWSAKHPGIIEDSSIFWRKKFSGSPDNPTGTPNFYCLISKGASDWLLKVNFFGKRSIGGVIFTSRNQFTEKSNSWILKNLTTPTPIWKMSSGDAVCGVSTFPRIGP